ncbi:MAG TPA: VOC family protein [Xanthobacteraceae bacterium]|jgi:catechol 2,3-dioxygenase-like lactoylglutathione lyase family enzyme
MRRLISALSLIASLAAGAAWAQPYKPNDAGVTMGHWHLNSRDVAATKKIFVALGGKPLAPGDFEIVQFPGVNVYLNQRAGTPPSTGGTVGTVINHVGFLVPNVQAAVAKLRGLDVTIATGPNGIDGRLDQAFVTTADGLKLEFLEDKNQTVPIRHHHIHYFVSGPAIPEMQAWYAKVFGAKPGMRGKFMAADVPGANLSFAKSDQPTVTTKGRVLDHIGFDVNDLDAFLKKAAAAGVTPAVAPKKNPANGVWLAFIYDPWGTYIELNQRPNQTYLDQM